MLMMELQIAFVDDFYNISRIPGLASHHLLSINIAQRTYLYSLPMDLALCVPRQQPQ